MMKSGGENSRFRLLEKNIKKSLTMRNYYAIIFYTCRRAYFFVQKFALQY